MQDPEEYFDQCCLSCAVWSKQSKDFPASDLQRDFFQGCMDARKEESFAVGLR
jgi:hypothetical protein